MARSQQNSGSSKATSKASKSSQSKGCAKSTTKFAQIANN